MKEYKWSIGLRHKATREKLNPGSEVTEPHRKEVIP